MSMMWKYRKKEYIDILFACPTIEILNPFKKMPSFITTNWRPGKDQINLITPRNNYYVSDGVKLKPAASD